MENIKDHRLTIALFYGRRCKSCNDQEDELERIEKELKDYGVWFVKLDINKFRKDIKKLPKGHPQRSWRIDVVPTIMMWLQNGVMVTYQWKPDGKFYSQLNGFISGDELYPKIVGLLRSF